MIKSRKFLKTVGYFSAVVPAGMSYFLNIYAAKTFEIQDYANYLYLISIATYLGTIANGGFVDLGVKNTKVELNEHRKNLVLSVYSTLVFSILMYILLPFIPVTNGGILVAFILLFSITRSYHLFLANNSLASRLLVSRLLRGVVLLLAPILFLVLNSFGIETTIGILIAIQCAGLIAGLLISIEVVEAIPTLLKLNSSFIPSKADVVRLSKRGLSLSVDLVHMPICFYFVKNLSAEEKIGGMEVLIFGLSIPITALLTQIITERVRALFASRDLESLYSTVARLKLVTLLVCMTALAIIVCVISLIVDVDLMFLVLLMVFIVNKFASSFSGILFYKAGLESVDLTLNLIITCLMVGVIIVGVNSATSFYIVFGFLAVKYVIANLYVFRHARKNI